MRRTSRKLFYKIGEVCEICSVAPHVLRYWESEFPLLSPSKNRAGQRIYRPKDLELVQTIDRLLHEEGYTIAGARKKMSEDSSGSSLPLFQTQERVYRETLHRVRRELETIADRLKKPLPE